MASAEGDLLDRAGREFRARGFVRVPFLVSEATKRLVADEVESLVVAHGVRREVSFAATGHTPRRMRNVRRADIAEQGSIVPRVYRAEELRAALEVVAGEEVLPCPYEPEQFVITELECSGDTHGWHWDDYSFALVWVIDCPPLEHGGFVQCVPDTVWNKADPQLHRQFVDRAIHSYELRPGDLYLMRTDTTLHRVFPLTRGRRLIINMAYAARRDLAKQITHETMDTLWATNR